MLTPAEIEAVRSAVTSGHLLFTLPSVFLFGFPYGVHTGVGAPGLIVLGRPHWAFFNLVGGHRCSGRRSAGHRLRWARHGTAICLNRTPAVTYG